MSAHSTNYQRLDSSPGILTGDTVINDFSDNRLASIPSNDSNLANSTPPYRYPSNDNPSQNVPLQRFDINNINNSNNNSQYYSDNTNYANNNFNNRSIGSNNDETSASFPEPLDEYTSPKIYISSPAKALALQTLVTLSTVVFTVVPVVVNAGDNESWGKWYSWKDACRIIEPLCSGLLHCWFFYNSDIMKRWTPRASFGQFKLYSFSYPGGLSNSRRSRTVLSVFFTIFLMIYVMGASIHAAAALFKNVVVLFLEQYSQGIGLSTHALTNGNGRLPVDMALQLREGYIMIQDDWEHNISHYMYAFGALGMSWCEMIAYSGQILPVGVNLTRVGKKMKLENGESITVVLKGKGAEFDQSQSSKWLIFLWAVAGILYGGIVAGVSCQYPKGLYIGSVYVVLLLLIVTIYIARSPTRGLFSLGRHYILQTYLIGGVVAAAAIIIYMAIHHFDMLTSNDKSHLGSLRPPGTE